MRSNESTSAGETTQKELEETVVPHFRANLSPEPGQGKPVECLVSHNAVTKGKRKARNRVTTFNLAVERDEKAGQEFVLLDQPALAYRLKAHGVGPTWPVTVTISDRVD
jgi:hypothetical protein